MRRLGYIYFVRVSFVCSPPRGWLADRRKKSQSFCHDVVTKRVPVHHGRYSVLIDEKIDKVVRDRTIYTHVCQWRPFPLVAFFSVSGRGDRKFGIEQSATALYHLPRNLRGHAITARGYFTVYAQMSAFLIDIVTDDPSCKIFRGSGFTHYTTR